MKLKLFVYGTLQQPRTQLELINRTLEGPLCTLSDYSVKLEIYDPTDGETYPGLVPNQAGLVYGRVYEVTPGELADLDAYETELYTREYIRVQNTETREVITAQVYMPAKNQ